MKIQEVVLKAMSGELKWYQAAEIIGISASQMRRWKGRYERHGYGGLRLAALLTSAIKLRSSLCSMNSELS